MNQKKGKKSPVIFLLLASLLVATLYSCFSIVFSQEKEISISNFEKTKKPIINLGILGSVTPPTIRNKERVNLLFLGMSGEGYIAPELTDTIIIINSTPKGEKTITISIPRDLLIKRPDGNYSKINAVYKEYRIEEMKKTIKEITDLEIDYFVIFDLNGVKNIIDQFNGIDVDVKESVYDPQFPGLYGAYEPFYLEKGKHHLDGETVIKYIRSRHQPEGDFARIQRQQQIIEILKDKILSLSPIWDLSSFLNVWKIIKNYTITNISLIDIKYAWNLIKNFNFKEMQFTTITNQGNKENSLLISSHVMMGNDIAYILKPKAGLNNYEEIKKYITNLVNQD